MPMMIFDFFRGYRKRISGRVVCNQISSKRKQREMQEFLAPIIPSDFLQEF